MSLMGRVADELRRFTGWEIALTAGEEDEFIEQSAEWLQLSKSASMLLRRRPLREICHELGGARLFVGNDCGISHLAAALGVPAAVFFVGSDPRVWAPWAPLGRVHVIDLRDEGWSRWDPTEVVAAVRRLGVGGDCFT